MTPARLQPTHCSKEGRRYRYYVSATIIRDAKSNRQGFRIPGPDLERIVTQSLAARLRDRQWLSSAFDLHADISGFGRLGNAADALATEIEQLPTRGTGILHRIVRRIEVDKKTHQGLDRSGRGAPDSRSTVGDTSQTDPSEKLFDLIIAGQFLRCGKQVRLVIGGGSDDHSQIDKRLIRDIVQARQWFADLIGGRASGIADLARRSACNAAHVSRQISLALLAPDIVEMILAGTQPVQLTPERLKQACPLPVSWDEQRALLLA